MFPSIKRRFPTPDGEIKSQHFTFPSRCSTLGTVHLGSNAFWGVRQIITLPSDPNKLNWLSSVHSTWSQKHRGYSRYFFAYWIHFIRLVLSKRGFFLATRPLNPASCNLRRPVGSEMIIPNSVSITTFTDDADFGRSAFIFRCIARWRYPVVLRFRPRPIMFSRHFVFLYLSMI